jgi:hypothetical protein
MLVSEALGGKVYSVREPLLLLPEFFASSTVTSVVRGLVGPSRARTVTEVVHDCRSEKDL